MHDRVLCNVNREKRNLNDDKTCPICKNEEEDLLHKLRDCPHVRYILTNFCPTEMRNNFFNESCIQTCLENCLKNQRVDETWSIAFPLICWWTWRWRNQIVFKDGVDIPVNKLKFLWGKIREAKAAITLNTDGVARGCPGQAGGGGLFQDYDGAFLVGFSLNLGHTTSIYAELRDFLNGLRMAKEKGYKQLDVRMDSMACVKILNYHDNYKRPSLQVVKQCEALIDNEEWIVIITHYYREANLAADWLANTGASQPEPTRRYNRPPTGLP
ncbi:hypothetical protein RDABS01_016472 [Bienertia sinuspersici]